jgi:N-acetylmuramoyl-L-alanine amidase
MKIFIDPGHGGSDPGAINNSILEKNINFSIALKLEALLKNNGFEVNMSRRTDIDVSLDTRCKLANDWKADIFVSIHHNACNGKVLGYEVIHSILRGKGVDLANLIANEFKDIGQKADSLGVWAKESSKSGQDYYAVIRQTNMPAVITEFGYIDSTDFQKFDSDSEQQTEANAIFKGICEYFNVQFWNINDINKDIGINNADWAKDHIQKALQNGIITSIHNPNELVTFGMMAALINNLYDKLKK